jgi:hypothetical protein
LLQRRHEPDRDRFFLKSAKNLNLIIKQVIENVNLLKRYGIGSGRDNRPAPFSRSGCSVGGLNATTLDN